MYIEVEEVVTAELLLEQLAELEGFSFLEFQLGQLQESPQVGALSFGALDG